MVQICIKNVKKKRIHINLLRVKVLMSGLGLIQYFE